jgi:AraC family transcriptional regulator
MCIHLLRQYVRCDLRDSDQASRLTNLQRDPLQQYINSRLSCPTSLKDIAATVDLSPSYFARVFVEQTGASPLPNTEHHSLSPHVRKKARATLP